MSTMETVQSSDQQAAPAGGAGGRTGRRVVLYTVLLAVTFAFVAILWKTGAFESKPRLAIVTASEDPYWDLVLRGAQDAAKRFRADLTIVRCKSDEEAQTAELEKLAAQHFDGVAVSPINPSRQTPTLSQLAQDTKLLTFDSDSPVLNRLCFVGTDNYQAGRTCGEQVKLAAPGGGEVLVSIGSLEKENGQRRRQGVIDELLDRTYDGQRAMDQADAPIKGPKYTVVTIVDGLDADKTTALSAEALKKSESIKCVVGLFAYSTPALLKGLEQSGKLGKVPVVGFDVNEPTLAGIEAGSVRATIMQDQYGCGFEAVRLLADSARGQRYGLPIFQTRMMGVEVVTKENVAEIREELVNPSNRP